MWKHLECELCKFNYPPVFRSDDAFYDLVELSKPTDIPYLLMEIKLKRYDVLLLKLFRMLMKQIKMIKLIDVMEYI